MTKTLIVLVITVLTCTACLQQDEIRELDSYLETNALRAEYGRPAMHLNIGKKLLWLARLVGPGDREFSDIVSQVKSVRIMTYHLNQNTLPALKAVRNATMKLKAQDWEPIVFVSEEDEQTCILVKLSDDSIEGMVIMSVHPRDEAVFINITGKITPSLVGRITRDMDIDVNI